MQSLNDILRLKARVAEQSFPITDALVSLERRRLEYLVLETGGWRERTHVLIRSDQINGVAPEGELVLNTGADTIENAPVMDSAEALGAMDRLPPVMVGPFGTTVAPLMMTAQLAPPPADESDPHARAALHRHDRFSQLTGLDIFGKDGLLGALTDVIVEEQDWRIVALGLGPGQIVPSELMRHVPEQETHLVLDVSKPQLDAAPLLSDADLRDGAALQRLQRHFGV